jgi:hypothetical protein
LRFHGHAFEQAQLLFLKQVAGTGPGRLFNHLRGIGKESRTDHG